jgi:transposase InsO family protein
MPLQGNLSIERMCQLVQVSRAGFYRWVQERRTVEEEMETRSLIQQIAMERRRRYGYRRVSAELRRRGMRVNHKRVARIMREDNLLAYDLLLWRLSNRCVGRTLTFDLWVNE